MGSKSAIGIGNGICFKQVRDKGGGSYIDPLVRDSIVGLWKFDQNTNESPTRNIIKNTIKGKGGDLELLNFGYKLNSGYNGYPEDFTSWGSSNAEVSKGGNKAKNTKVDFNLLYTYSDIKRDVGPFKVKISNFTKGIIKYYYRQEDGIEAILSLSPIIVNNSNGLIELPKSYNTVENGTGFRGGFTGNDTNIGVTIEQLPLYEGALVTDGKDDTIVSQKTVQEMLGGSNVCTVVSMIHQINLSAGINTSINNIRSESVAHVCARHLNTAYGKTGIFGYSKQLNTTSNPTLINNILGDKKDYIAEGASVLDTTDKYFVQGYKYNDSLHELSEVAIYWTFIANKVLTTDEINQIIAYFKLDKYVTPQVIYDVKRQGLTNDTPAADWYLKDFSGNGHDMQLYNYAKKGNSGVGKYIEDFTVWTKIGNFVTITDTSLIVTNGINKNWLLAKISSNSTIESFRVKITGIPSGGTLSYLYTKSKEDTKVTYLNIKEDGVYVLPSTVITDAKISIGFSVGYFEDYTGLTIEQIPDYEGALVSDGKDDYGHADNLPIFKDYTVAIDRVWIGSLNRSQCLATKNLDPGWGAFNFELLEGTSKNTYSFGGVNNNVSFDANRKISYQSKYSYNGSAINIANVSDGKDLFLFRSRSAFPYYAEAAVWSYLLFPYSLSEFLLERQLKKYKLGTLYPDMVEWKPIYSSNLNEYTVTKTTVFNTAGQTDLTIGKHYPIGSQIRFYVKPNGISDEVVSIKVNEVEFTFDYIDSTYGYAFNGTLSDKSPQKINITIDEYIRFEDINLTACYPFIPILEGYTWGDKLKVGTEVKYAGFINLLPNIYLRRGEMQLNGVNIESNTLITVSKSMVFFMNKTWLLDTTEPHAIYSPQKLNIPNSSLKILGYVPDLTGKGNHGRLNNFAYTEDSGVAADGSIKFDGTDDHITIPTLAHGGKCVMMKVNWNKDGLMLYDQRKENNPNSFAIYIPIFNNENSIAYSSRNDGETYIDGVLNTYVKGSQLKDVTHNITITNSNSNNDDTVSPAIGSNAKYNAYYAQMSLYEFMLFPEIPSEDEIKKLNDVMGIEGGYVESPNYYWDSFGKSNNRADDIDKGIMNINDSRTYLFDKSVEGLSTIEQINISGQIGPLLNRALQLKNVAYNSESGYTDDNGLLLDEVEDHAINIAIPAVTDFTVIAKRTDLRIIDDPTSSFIQKGLSAVWNTGGAFSEGRTEADKQYCSTFGNTNNISDVYNKEFFYETKNSYNGKAINIINNRTDSNGLSIGAAMNNGSALGGYWKGVFYKLMLYTKTIDQLSINMLRNLFERDELIDVTNPIFKKDEL